MYAIYIINNNVTIRKCAEFYNVSKSTIHNYISKKLYKTNKFLYFRVYKVLNRNLKERHIRGGIATKLKFQYLKLKK